MRHRDDGSLPPYRSTPERRSTPLHSASPYRLFRASPQAGTAPQERWRVQQIDTWLHYIDVAGSDRIPLIVLGLQGEIDEACIRRKLDLRLRDLFHRHPVGLGERRGEERHRIIAAEVGGNESIVGYRKALREDTGEVDARQHEVPCLRRCTVIDEAVRPVPAALVLVEPIVVSLLLALQHRGSADAVDGGV